MKKQDRQRDSESFGRYIWKARRKKGWSQRELAAKVGVDYTYLSKLENDHVDPSEKVIRELARHLELNAEELIYLSGRMTQLDEEALEELVKTNYKEMGALFRRVRENPGIDSLVQARDEQITRLQRENDRLKAKISDLDRQLHNYRFYSKEEIESSADEILRHTQADRAAPKWHFDVERAAEFLDLRIRFDRILPDRGGPIIAKILVSERQIVLNQDITKPGGLLTRSVVAHQIGHWVIHVRADEAYEIPRQLHQTPDRGGNLPPFLCRSVSEQLSSYRINSDLDLIEWQAQYFASFLLMPRYILEKKINGLNLTNWRHIYAMADELGVTISNLVVRLQDLGWIYIPNGSRQIYVNQSEFQDTIEPF